MSPRGLLVLILGLPALANPPAAAAQTTPVGLWQTIGDADGQPMALVEIREADGGLIGVVKALLAKGEPQDRVCDRCSGDRKGQRIVGMEILRRMRRDGDEWTGGEILDPENGKTYRAKMHLEDSGKKLVVRGFIGFALFGRSQTWIRADTR